MKFRLILWVILVFLAAGLLFTAESWLLQHSIADKTLRLHVVANSDSPEDQALKLQVRDLVLEQIGEMTGSCDSVQEAEEQVTRQLPQLQQRIEAFLDSRGVEGPVRITLCRERFDTRVYDSFSLPAGQYRSLRVSIGEAKGKNWWCVVFPSLCSAATGDGVAQCARWKGYEEEECQIITGGEEEYVLRFKILEWLNNIF